MSRYVYKPLQSGHIRLLDLYSPSTARLVTTTYDATFTALSYCWGSPERTATISIDGEALPITATLKAALTKIPRTRIWVDQICINQDDDNEKTQQVRSMSRIYQNATKTFVYLGPDLHQLGPVLQYLATTPLAGQTSLQVDRTLHSALIDFLRGCGYEWPWQTLMDLTQFGGNVYFTRTWVIQECALAGRDRLCFLLGDTHLSWASVRCSWRLAQYMEPDKMSFVRNPHWSPDATTQIMPFQALLEKERVVQHGNADLWHLVKLWNNKCQCTDPRDRLYAFHSLASDNVRLPAIDYRRTNYEIQLEHAEYFLEHADGYLDLLATTGAYQDADIPSWCLKHGEDMVRYLCDYKDAADAALQPAYTVHGPLLHVRGLVIDRIIEVTKHEDTSLKLVLTSCWTVARHLQELISLHYQGDYQKAGRSALRSLRAIYMPILTFMSPSAYFNEDVDIWQTSSNESWELAFVRGCYAAQRTLAGMNYMLRNCRVVITAGGHIGLSYKETAAGDAVAIIANVQRPVVLRPSGQAFRLLWMARFEGLMHGEALDSRDKMSRAVYESIVLC